MTNIAKALTKQFEKHRIVFWYNEKEEEHIRAEYEAVNLPEVEKVQVQGNEFAIKYRVEKTEPDKQFLLYFEQPHPANEDNWLLDLELAYYVFHTDQEALFIQELGIDFHYKELVGQHVDFFRAKDRRNKLKEKLKPDDAHRQIREKILSVVFETESGNWLNFIHAHGTAYIQGKEEYDKQLEQYGLSDFYWNELKRRFNYQSEETGIYSFLLEVFKAEFVLTDLSRTKSEDKISQDARLLLSQWKNTYPYRDSFAALSERIAEGLALKEKLNKATIDAIVKDNLFKLSDQKIISDLVGLLCEDAISQEKVQQYIKERENKFFYSSFSWFYTAIEYAAELIALVKKYGDNKYPTLQAAAEDYTKNLYAVDYAYRKFTLSYRKTNQDGGLTVLAEKVEKIYANDWLLTFNNTYQKLIDELEVYPIGDIRSQRQFFSQHVRPFLDKKPRLFVIISDAFRYECGVELVSTLQSEKRFEASLDYMVSTLPSYTQLGMAALLPATSLSFKEGDELVLADGKSTKGTEARAKVLSMNAGCSATAIQAERFMGMNSNTEGRAFVKEHDLIYIYHNQIDKTGDDTATEDKVFEAVESELVKLKDLVKKISNVNGSNIFITADHGFIYQSSKVDESDFSVVKFKGEKWKENRRYFIGKNLTPDKTAKYFTAEQLGLDNPGVDVMIPKSVNRLRVSGAGSRFIHGGASMQETIIPLVKINIKKKGSIKQVDVDIIKSTDRITTNMLSVSFIQSELVTNKVLAREIKAALYAEDGTILSDSFTFNFDIEAGSERQREVKHGFQLSSKASSTYKNQTVQLRLEEPVEGTSSQWRYYNHFSFTLNISFGSDFDF